MPASPRDVRVVSSEVNLPGPFGTALLIAGCGGLTDPLCEPERSQSRHGLQAICGSDGTVSTAVIERQLGAPPREHRYQGPPVDARDHYQLNTSTLIRHAARTYPEQEIVFRTPDGGWNRYTYADCYTRIKKAANVLRGLGVGPPTSWASWTGTASATSSSTGRSRTWVPSCCR